MNLARASISSREVIDVCSIQKACWETVTDLSQTPWTPRTWPNAFRNSQMAAIEGFAVPNLCTCACVCVHGGVWVPGFVCLSVCRSVCLFSVCLYKDKKQIQTGMYQTGISLLKKTCQNWGKRKRVSNELQISTLRGFVAEFSNCLRSGSSNL